MRQEMIWLSGAVGSPNLGGAIGGCRQDLLAVGAELRDANLGIVPPKDNGIPGAICTPYPNRAVS